MKGSLPRQGYHQDGNSSDSKHFDTLELEIQPIFLIYNQKWNVLEFRYWEIESKLPNMSKIFP
jgi:hypothetical protein